MVRNKKGKSIPETLTDNPKVRKSMKAIQRAGWWSSATGLVSLVFGTLLVIWLGIDSGADSGTIAGIVILNAIINGWLLYSGLRIHKLKDSSLVTKLLLWLNLIVICLVPYLNEQASESGSSSNSGFGLFAAIAFIMTVIALFKTKPYKEWRHSSKSKAPTTTANNIKSPDAYGTILLGFIAKVTDDLRKKHHLTVVQEGDLFVQLVGFCIITLMRDFRGASIQPHKSREFISEVLRTIARVSNPENEQDAYTELNRVVGKLSREYGSLPSSNANPNILKGTLLWEYTILMNKTMGKDKSDVISLAENVSVITSINEALDTTDIVKSLQFNY